MAQIKSYWHIIRRGWWIILLTTLIAVIGAAAITASAPRVYQSFARYIVSPNQDIYLDDSDLVRRSLDTLDNSGILVTYAEVFGSKRMKEEGIKALGLSAAEMGGYEITAVNLPQTKIVQLSVRGEDPQKAMDLAAAIGSESSTYMEDLYAIYKVSELDPASVPTRSLNVSPARNAVIAGLLGFVIGVGLAFIYGYLRQEQESSDMQTDSVPV